MASIIDCIDSGFASNSMRVLISLIAPRLGTYLIVLRRSDARTDIIDSLGADLELRPK